MQLGKGRALALKFLRVLLSTTILAAACGGPDGPITYSREAGELVLRVENVGGFLPPEEIWRRTPDFSLYGDGRVIVPRKESAAVTGLVTFRLNESELQTLLRNAREAGLMKGNRRFSNEGIADASTTVITVVADGRSNRTSAYALGFEPGRDTRKIVDFVEETRNLVKAQEGAEEYEADRIQVIAIAETSRGEAMRPGQEGEADRAEWPLATPLSELGEEFDDPSGFGIQEARCAVVEGALLTPALEGATDATIWISRGEEFIVVFRPLLPDEKGCS